MRYQVSHSYKQQATWLFKEDCAPWTSLINHLRHQQMDRLVWPSDFVSVGPKKRIKIYSLSHFNLLRCCELWPTYFLEGEEKLCVLFIWMGGMGWRTAPTTEAAPRRRLLREFGAEEGDKGRNTSVLSTRIWSPEMCDRSAAFYWTGQGVSAPAGSLVVCFWILKPWWWSGYL
jgi:hypothetical protein